MWSDDKLLHQEFEVIPCNNSDEVLFMASFDESDLLRR
jgi:hypothetical protein